MAPFLVRQVSYHHATHQSRVNNEHHQTRTFDAYIHIYVE